jgi:hypothetical protein
MKFISGLIKNLGWGGKCEVMIDMKTTLVIGVITLLIGLSLLWYNAYYTNQNSILTSLVLWALMLLVLLIASFCLKPYIRDIKNR